MNRNDDTTHRLNADCQWIDTSMEAFFSDTLTPLDRSRFESHVAACSSCTAEIEELRAVDPLMKNLLRYRVALAESAALDRPRIHWGRLAALAGVPAFAGAIVLAVALWPQAQPAPGRQLAIEKPPVMQRIDKDKEPVQPDPRLKPEATIPARKPPSPDRRNVDVLPTEDFAVIDAANQIFTLADFRGHYFLFGVLSPGQPRTAANLERLNLLFGSELRLVAVSHNRQEPAPPKTTFQTFYNNGSRLLDARESDFILIDASGAVVLKGSLSTSDTEALTQSVRAALGPQKKP